jgi:hypothetical protein
MRNVLIALIVLALAVPAFATQNPWVGLYLYTTSSGIGGTNWKASPGAGSNTSVYVCFDRFGPMGLGDGGMYAAQWLFHEVPGPDYMNTTNQFVGVGGLTIGTPGIAPGCAMTVGPTPVYPNANGIIVLARIRYETPDAGAARGGYIEVLPYSAGDGGVVADANNMLDDWCVHSIAANGLSGHFGWDAPPTIDGDCPPITTPVEEASWGSIKALYR